MNDTEKQAIEEMRKDLIEIFNEEYEERRLITAKFTAEKMSAKGYRRQGGRLTVNVGAHELAEKMFEEKKLELIKEIFSEIEDVIVFKEDARRIAQLKKKYTEEGGKK